jgi:hypothetical protein
MDEEQKGKSPPMSGNQVAQFIFGVVLYGVLMGLRTEFRSVWMRMLVGACAGTVLGMFVLLPKSVF